MRLIALVPLLWALIFLAAACRDDINQLTDVELPDARVDTVTVVEPAPPPDTIIIELPAPPPDTVTIVIDTRLEDGVWCKFGNDLYRATRYSWRYSKKTLWVCSEP